MDLPRLTATPPDRTRHTTPAALPAVPPRPATAAATVVATPAATLDSPGVDGLQQRYEAERARYLAVRVLLLGEKVGDPASGESGRADAAAVRRQAGGAPSAGPPGAPAGVQVTAEVHEQHTSVQLTVASDDGSTTTVAVDVVQREVAVRVEPLVKSADPLVLDLDGDGVELTTAADGARFDLTGSGQQVQAAAVAPDDGYLVLDRDGDGQITSGRELFGEQHGAADGFAELARFDENRDGTIDVQDAVYAHLQVWRDRNRNGQSEAGELQSLSALNITALDMASAPSDQTSAGNRITQVSSYRTTDGQRHLLADAQLDYLA